MPKKYNWVFVKSFDTKLDFETYLATKISTSIDKKNDVKCKLCYENTDNHKMHYRTRMCSSSTCNQDKIFEFQYKTLTCIKSNWKLHLYSLNQHNVGDNINQTEDKHYKICDQAKEAIETLIYDKDIFYPLKIFNALKKEMIVIQPTLSQVQNYIKYRRRKLGDENSIEGVYNFVKQHG